jgi:hypothetical protein
LDCELNMEPRTDMTCSSGSDLSTQSAIPYNNDVIDTPTLTEYIELESPEDKTPESNWTSVWLRKPTLLALIALFTALIASLIVLLTVEQAHDGIRPSVSSNHYAWTYGPTAALVVVLSLWRQVDYYCKLMQPWQEMSESAKDADNSLMLDYVSPLLVTSWIRAVRRRHVPVAASITGFTVLKLVILFSTGLLVLRPTLVSRRHPITLTTGFATDRFWNFVHPNEGGTAIYSNVSTEPVYAYINSLKDQGDNYNISLNNMVFQSFEPNEMTESLSITTEVDAFVPNISCEIAQYSFRAYLEDELVVRLDSTTCSVGAEHQTILKMEGYNLECRNDTCPPFVIQYNFWRVNCSDVGDAGTGSETDYTPHDYRFALLVSNSTIETVVFVESNYNHTEHLAIPHETAAVICKIDYSMNKATIVHDTKDGSNQVDHLATTGHIDNITGTKLGDIMQSALWASEGLDMRDHEFDDFSLKIDPQATVPLYYVLLRTLVGEQSMSQFLSAETLQSSAQQVWAGIASQLVRESFIRTDNVNSTATEIIVEYRLHVGLVSLWAMVIGFFLLIILTICVMATTYNNVVPQDPGYLSMSGSVMITSSTMTEALSACGALRTSQLSNSLSRFEFTTEFDQSFRIKATIKSLGGSKKTEKETEKQEKQKVTYWIPLAAQYPMVSLTLIVPLLAIVSLEILYRTSCRSYGLLDIFDKEKMATYLSRYLSSSIVLLIATLFNSLDFAVASYAPYSLLRSGAMPGSRSLCLNLVGKLAPVALLNSIQAHHVSSVLSNSAGMIGSTLTIVSSGLWVINRTVVTEIPITASLTDDWDVSWYNSSGSGDGGAGVSFDSFQHGGTALPSSSWHNVVYPSIAELKLPPSSDPSGDSTTQNMTIQLEGLRPRLDCEVVADKYLGIDYWNEEEEQLVISAGPPLPPGCGHAGTNGTDAFYQFSAEYLLSNNGDVRWFGNFFDLHLGPWYGEDPNNMDPEYFNFHKDNPAGCPSIGILFTANHANKTSHDDISALLCSQRIERVKLNVTYSGHDMTLPSISTNIEPLIISGAAEYLTNGTKGFESFPYRVQTYLQSLTRFQLGDGDDRVDWTFDEVMDHVIYGPNGTTAEDLAGKANRGRLAEAVGNLYTNYMTFVIDQRFRQPISQKSTQETNQVTGTAYRYTSQLQMNYASKLALQIMLATMTVLGASAFWLTDLRGTLPRKPTTIASTLALFAGSDMCDERKPLIPRDALWKHGKELDKALDGWLFSLGWWPKTRRDVDTVSNETDEASGDALLETKEVEGRRFGIDVGVAEQLGFR